MPRRPLAALVVVGASLWGAPSAGACGMPLEASVPAEQALISHAGGREEMVLRVVLDTTGPNAALVTPVPGVPDTPTVVKGDLFGYLEEVTAPEPKSSGGGDDGATSAAPPGGGVDVIGRDVVGDYDIARIASDDPDALATWLEDNGYETPPGAQPIIDSYVADDWKFVAIKLRDGAKPGGPIEPVRVAFPSTELVYPMRLDALEKEPMDLDLYVLADHQMRVEGDPLPVDFAGRVDELSKPPPADVRSLFRAPYLTRLHGHVNTQALKDDFVLVRSAISTSREGDVEDDTNFPVLVIVLVVVPLLALSGFAIWLVRRRREAPPA